MLLIQVAAALMLLLGSAMIFKALLELDAPKPVRRPGRVPASVRRTTIRSDESDELPRAA